MGRDQGVPVSKKLNKSEELLLEQRNPVRSWAASTGASSRDYPILVSVCQATPGILLSVLVSPVQKRYGQAGEGGEEGHRDDQRAEKPDTFGEAEKVGLVQH